MENMNLYKLTTCDKGISGLRGTSEEKVYLSETLRDEDIPR